MQKNMPNQQQPANPKYCFGKPRLLIVGCGDVGRRLLPLLTKTHRVFALTSQPENAQILRLAGAIPIVGNLDQIQTLKRLSNIASTVVHLAPPNPDGVRDLRTQNLLRILSQGRQVHRIIYISTSGVYGDCQGEWVSEERTLQPKSPRGRRRMDAEAQVRAWGVTRNACVSILRVPGIYAENRLPIDRIRSGTPALSPDQDVFTNHIHADDLARLIIAAIYKAMPQRVINASDSSGLKMGEYFDAVASAYGLESPPRVSREELKALVSPMMLSFMQESRRLRNSRLNELGFKLRYPTVADFLQVLARKD